MNNKEILELKQMHGDMAFTQGYVAAKLGIPFDANGRLSKMPEALCRALLFEKIFHAVNKIRSEHGD